MLRRHSTKEEKWKEANEAKLDRQTSWEKCHDVKLMMDEPMKKKTPQPWRTVLPASRDKYHFSLFSFLKSTIGKDLTKVPMPVYFNEPLSFLQRLTEDVEYADLLNKAAQCECSLERLCYIAAFASSNFANIPGRFWKPFNPLLGETFEFHHPEHDYWVVAEQVSHHPPVSAIHVESSTWVFWEEYRLDTRFRGVYVKICPTGMVHLKMKDTGQHYSWKKPSTSIHNIIFGTLWVDHEGEQLIVNHQTGEEAVVCFRNYKKVRDEFLNLTGYVNDKAGITRYNLQGGWMEGLEAVPVEGSDKKTLKLWKATKKPDDATRYFGLTQFAMHLNEHDNEVKCPTDSRFRPDQRSLENGLVEEAGKEKFRLEEKQRFARKKRETNNIEWEPRWFYPALDADTGTTSHVYKGGYWTAKKNDNFENCPDIF